MINITNLTLRNFLSTGNVTQALKLNETGLTLVLGSNTDANGGTTRNGAGKSAILQAISYALFGKPLTKIRIPNLVNNINNKGMMVTIEFMRDSNTYRIERGQKPAFLRFYVNNSEIKDDETDLAQGENRHTQEEIERIIGMSHTMFKHIVALNTFTEPFLKMSVSDQRAVIEELLGITQLSQRADTLKKLAAQTKEGIRDQEAQVRATAEANSRIENAINQTEVQAASWERHKQNRIKDLQEQIAALSQIDFDAEIAMFDLLDAFVQNEREFKSIIDNDTKERNRIEKEIKQKKTERSWLVEDEAKCDIDAAVFRINMEIARKNSDLEKKNKTLATLHFEQEQAILDLQNSDNSTCVCCGQSLVGTDHIETVVANLNARIETIRSKIADEQKSVALLVEEIEACKQEIELVKISTAAAIVEIQKRRAAIELVIEDSQAKYTSITQRINDYETRLTALGKKPKPTFSSRNEAFRVKQGHDALNVELEQEIAKTNPYVSQIESLRGTLQEIDYGTLNDLNELFKHQDFLLRLLTGKDSFIRKRIIDQNLSYLNVRLNMYLDKLGLPHEVRFLSDLSVEITLLGRDFDFEQLSRGEMNRVIMATSWSFRDVWESMNDSLNIILVDEFLDQGTDGMGAEAGLTVLKMMARDRKKNVLLISHRDDLIGRIDHVLLVRKTNGFSSFDLDGVLD